MHAFGNVREMEVQPETRWYMDVVVLRCIFPFNMDRLEARVGLRSPSHDIMSLLHWYCYSDRLNNTIRFQVSAYPSCKLIFVLIIFFHPSERKGPMRKGPTSAICKWRQNQIYWQYPVWMLLSNKPLPNRKQPLLCWTSPSRHTKNMLRTVNIRRCFKLSCSTFLFFFIPSPLCPFFYSVLQNALRNVWTAPKKTKLPKRKHDYKCL